MMETLSWQKRQPKRWRSTIPNGPSTEKKNGLDPLGLQNSSINLYQTLLPGISNVALRMRYYGSYAWLCRTYAQRIRSTNPEDWKRFIRRAEALYALIACKRGGESGVGGIEWAQKTLAASGTGSIDFATAAEPGSETCYLKQAWGIYGAAYRSQLFEIGILSSTPEHEIPLPNAGSVIRRPSAKDADMQSMSSGQNSWPSMAVCPAAGSVPQVAIPRRM